MLEWAVTVLYETMHADSMMLVNKMTMVSDSSLFALNIGWLSLTPFSK